MNVDWIFATAQMMAIVSCVICMAGMQFKTVQNILMSIILGSVFGVTGLLLLGATTGAVLQAIFGVQTLINYLCARKSITVGKLHAAIYIIIGAACGLATYHEPIDLLPVLASILHVIVILQKDERRLRKINLASLSLWIPYYIASGAYGNILSVVAIGTSNVIGILRLDKRYE